jgi:polyphosphate kinase
MKNMRTNQNVDDINEQELLQSIYERSNSIVSYEKSAVNEQSTTAAISEQTVQSDNSKRINSKQRKFALEEFRQQFMQVPKIDDRKPVFISLSVRDSLERIVRLFGEHGMSVSGLVENLARNFLETYRDDIEQWRKM